MMYVALGDSVTYGYSSTKEQLAFPRRLARKLSARQRRYHVYLQAKPGWTSKQLLKSLESVQDCIWEEAKLVTLMIGGNDLLRSSPWLLNGNHDRLLRIVDRYHENVTKIVETAKRPQQKFLIATLYNPFPNSLLAEEYTDLVNEVVRRVARRHRLTVVDIASAFRGRESKFVDGYKRGSIRDFKLIGNPIHPSDEGHAAMSNAFARAYWRLSARKPHGVQRSNQSKGGFGRSSNRRR